jgi:hypothetical protein
MNNGDLFVVIASQLRPGNGSYFSGGQEVGSSNLPVPTEKRLPFR